MIVVLHVFCIDLLDVIVLWRITKTFKPSVPGLRRQFPDSSRGPRFTNLAAREVVIFSAIAAIIPSCKIRQPVGRSLFFKYGQCFHEDIQSNMHDATDRSLVRLPPIPRTHAPRISCKLLGCYQRITGSSTFNTTLFSI
jgi:hypothetical protein